MNNLPLEQVHHPEGRYFEDCGGEIGCNLILQDNLPNILLFTSCPLHFTNDPNNKLPDGAKYAKNNEVVEDKKEVQLVGNMSFSGGLLKITKPDQNTLKPSKGESAGRKVITYPCHFDNRLMTIGKSR